MGARWNWVRDFIDNYLDEPETALMLFRKTTIAVEFCYRRRKAQPQAHIIWVHGNSDETFKASYQELGQGVGLKGDNEEEWLNEVIRWLESSASGDWIMVIDNFDDIKPDGVTMEYIPRSRGTVLFTTRDKRLIGHPAYLSPNAGVEIPAMSDQEASETLLQLLGDASQIYLETSRQLLALLGNLPLAIAQAAAYIRETSMELSKYLELFKKCERNQRDLLSEALPVAIRNEGHTSRAVMTTWEITTDKIQQESPVSIQLLELISFLDPEGIPEELIKEAPFFKNQSPIFFTNALRPLISFALLNRLEFSNYRLHRLVGFWTRVQIDLKKDIQEKQERLEMAVDLVQDSIPPQKEDERQKCIQLLPHAVAVLDHAGRHHMEFNSRWDLEDSVGAILDVNEHYINALDWLQRALDGKEKALGTDHLSTVHTVQHIAIVFTRQGKYDKALEWYQRALDGREKVLGNDHPSTLHTVNNMAFVFNIQGKYDKALEWYQRALDGCEKALGNDHPSTLSIVNNMAIVFDNQGRYDKALEWYQRALDGCEKALGNDHPSTLDTIHNMALVFDNQGRYDKALEWYQRALDGCEKALGNDHPSTLGTVNNMALVFDKQGEYNKAVEWFQRALGGYEKALGSDHPSTIRTVRNMAIAKDHLSTLTSKRAMPPPSQHSQHGGNGGQKRRKRGGTGVRKRYKRGGS